MSESWQSQMNRQLFVEMSDHVPGIRVEDPSGQELSAPFLSGPEAYQGERADQFANDSFSGLYMPNEFLTGTSHDYPVDLTFPPRADPDVHLGLPVTPPQSPYDTRFTTLRSPTSPSDDGFLYLSPRSTPQSTPGTEMLDSFSQGDLSPGIMSQPLAAALEDVVISDFWVYPDDGVSDAGSALFGGMPASMEPPFAQESIPGDAERSPVLPDTRSIKTLRLDVNVPPVPQNSTSSLPSGSAGLGSPFPFSHALPPPQHRDRTGRHSFSGESSSQYLLHPDTEVVGSRRGSWVTNSSSTSLPLLPSAFEDEDDDLSADYSNQSGFSTAESSTVPESPVRVIKQIVTSPAMKKASSGRRKHPSAFPCHICPDSFTTNFSLKRHINSHTKQQSFECGYPSCDKIFRNASDRNRHYKKQHSK